jgi:hypothetical protein
MENLNYVLPSLFRIAEQKRKRMQFYSIMQAAKLDDKENVNFSLNFSFEDHKFNGE